MNEALLFKPKPYKGESVRGFLLRIVEENLLERSSWIKGVPLEAEQIRLMMGSVLHGRAPIWLQDASDSGELPSSSYRLAGVRCCPECLSESPYWRAEWEHVLYVICHRHRRRMQGLCPHCKSKLIWERSELLRCKCGSQINDWPPDAIASNEEVQLCNYVANAFLNAQDNRVCGTEGDFDHMLSTLTLSDLETLIITFGAYGERREEINRSGPHRTVELEDANKLVSIAANLLTDWPNRFDDALMKIGGYNLSDGKSHEPPNEYRNFLRVIRNRFDSPGLSFAKIAYQNFVLHNWSGVLNHRQKWIDKESLDAQRYMTAGAACKALGVSRRRVRLLIEEKNLRGYIARTSNGREFIVVDRSSLVSAEKVLGDHIPLADAATLLGLPSGRVCELVVAGILPEIRKSSTPRRICLFSRKEIATFIKRLTAGRREPSEDEESVAGRTLLKTHLASSEEFCAFIQAVLLQQIATLDVSSSVHGFSGLRFVRSHFYKWRSKHRMGNECCKITVPDAADVLGVKQEVAYHLVRTKLLTSTPVLLGKKTCTMVWREDIKIFQSTYVSATELALIAKTSPKAIVRNLQYEGIHPITGPNIDGCRQYFFQRARTVGLTISKLNESVSAKI